MIKLGVISGSGLDNIAGVNYVEDIEVDTKYGKPSAPYKHYRSDIAEYYVLSRHGNSHELAPDMINYRANVMGFKELGVKQVVTFSAVGGINKDYPVGSLVLMDNAIDMTSGRINTFFTEGNITHVDLTYPFCHDMRKALQNTADSLGTELKQSGVYVCTNGPRLETSAEINMYKMFGADVVGMTLFPEVILFREAELCYANISLISNTAAGVVADHKLTCDEMVEEGKKATQNISKIIAELPKFMTDRACLCGEALQGAGF